MRVLIQQDPFADQVTQATHDRGRWPCSWIGCPDVGHRPWVVAYCLRFAMPEAATVRIHVSADERYELLLDATHIGRGPERGDRLHWHFESYDLDLSAGGHVLVARVWALGDKAPMAQLSVNPGFLLAAEPPHLQRLSTGHAPWQAKRLGGYGFTAPRFAFGVGHNVVIDASAFDWGSERGAGDNWQPAVTLTRACSATATGLYGQHGEGHMLVPAMLPAMLKQPVPPGDFRFVSEVESDDTEAIPINPSDHRADEVAPWQHLLNDNAPLTVEPNTCRRVIVDLRDYYCAYPHLTTSGGQGASIRIHWAESLFLNSQVKHDREKGNRDEIDSKFFCGLGDTFLPNGGSKRHFDTLWWQAGRYLEILVTTADEPLTIESMALCETRYPLENESHFDAQDARLSDVAPIMFRTLQMCSHETYFDCPYYEQLMYVGDTRTEMLATYVTTHDDRLPRKAIELFFASRLPNGLTQSRYPSRDPQIIAPFSLWWIGLVHDFALWRGDMQLVARMMPGVRGVIDYFMSRRNDQGLIESPIGWNYMDWCWQRGVPPDGDGVSGVINWQTVLALTMARSLEQYVGEIELAARAERLANELARCATRAFWDDSRKMLADDPAREHFSEHTQCLALLSGKLPAPQRDGVARGLLEADNLTRTTIYFSHYLFETYYLLGRTDAMLRRMSLWFEHIDKGLRTTIEAPEPTRSDCHAWGAHPLYHYFASLLGIRPSRPGMAEIRIRPQPALLEHLAGRMPHPNGWVEVDLKREGKDLSARICLPPDVTGTFEHRGRQTALTGGEQSIRA